MSDDRSSLYRESDRNVFRLSALGGSCTTALLAHLLDFEPLTSVPDAIQRGYNEGHTLEAAILEAGMQQQYGGCGFRLLDVDNPASSKRHRDGSEQMRWWVGVDGGQHTVEIPVGSRAIIRGHLDGTAQVYVHELNALLGLGDRVVVEAKAFGPDYHKKWAKVLSYKTPARRAQEFVKLFPGYAWQVAAQMLGTGLPCLFVVGEKERDADGGETRLINVTGMLFLDMPMSEPAIKAKVMRVLAMADRLRDEGVRDFAELPACDMRMYPCPFFHLHPEPVAAEVESLDGLEEMSEVIVELGGAVEEYNTAQVAESEARKVKDRTKKVIAELFEKLNRRGKKVRVSGFEVEDYIEDIPERNQTVRAHTRRYPKITKLERER